METKEKFKEIKIKKEEINKNEIDELKNKNEIDELKNKNLFLLSEMENLRKKHENEKQQLSHFFSLNFLKDLMPNIDMIDSFLNMQNSNPEVEKWINGFKMVFNQLNYALEKNDVKKIKVNVGEEFNYNFHDSIDNVFSEEIPKGKIIEIKQNGYTLNGKLIKPSLVIVSKGKEDIEKIKE